MLVKVVYKFLNLLECFFLRDVVWVVSDGFILNFCVIDLNIFFCIGWE